MCLEGPLVDKDNVPEVLYHYGKALFNSGLHNQKLEFEGLACMEQSGKLEIEFAKEKGYKNVSDYHHNYRLRHFRADARYGRYGMKFLWNSVILAPSKAHWDEFKKTKLDTRMPFDNESLKVCDAHNLQEIAYLKEKYGITFVQGIPWICMYIKKWGQSKEIGNITVNIDNGIITTGNSITLTESQKELEPAIRFAQDIMQRCADTGSVVSMFNNLKYTGDQSALKNDAEYEPQECSICCGTVNSFDKQSACVLSCHHVFHRDCIKLAVQTKRSCPNCRVDISIFEKLDA